MTYVIHPRPNPIIAAMYTLRDMDVDVIVVHGPAGCGFMASRMLEEAGVRVVTSGMKENDLIFGGADALIHTLQEVKRKFAPRSVAVIGTCASTIIGDDMAAAIRRADMGPGCTVFPVNCSGCLGDNTEGAVRALNAGAKAGFVPQAEADRQAALLRAATALEKRVGMASREYLSPAVSPTKLNVCRRIVQAFRDEKKVAVVMIAKKELAYRFADLFVAVDEARRTLGGQTFFVANLDGSLGLPRIRRYCANVGAELDADGVRLDAVIGGLDEYAVVGDRMQQAVDAFAPDLRVFIGICHAYPDLRKDDILITDQPRELANYLDQQFIQAVGEISSHSMVMGATGIVHLETADTLRELVREG
ncbi:MAG: Ni-sirohydrochlorin a,c-diamide reductive cyclase catalytic subunit [Candidatus Methanomethylophilus sp.]|nr:Ni-sirohydrochlorin a,c-diamide reductive cyclase catalytic subunit [Methanomethylophilus sp.]MDD4221604.1 Ni-sirohydrochlorin a,c-diamide reductive cyclase catalytic subunit [Methanomethylophilus sp.]MDD4668834.1 Ni-sirohydrochlorin a,c-diamide reductive cyclase catalytic subunit [Methanomethylophilus sp.]